MAKKEAFIPDLATDAAIEAAELGETRWAIQGIVPEGACLLAGAPKLGKSWLALNLALAIAHGGVALGKIQVEQGNVLYLALEDGPRRLQKRLRKLMQASGSQPTGRIYFATRWARCRDGGLAALKDQMQKLRPRLVIIDTLARIQDARHGTDNAYVSDYQVISPLQELALEMGIAILFITHVRKGGSALESDPLEEVSGSMGLTGAADVVLVLKRKRSETDGKLFVTGRDIEEATINLHWDPRYCLWQWTEEVPHSDLNADQRQIVAILDQAQGPLTLKQIVEKLNSPKGYEAIARTIRRMAADGFIRKDGYATYLAASELSDPSESRSDNSDNSDPDPPQLYEETPWD